MVGALKFSFMVPPFFWSSGVSSETTVSPPVLDELSFVSGVVFGEHALKIIPMRSRMTSESLRSEKDCMIFLLKI